MGAGLDTQTPTRSPSSSPKSSQKHRSQPRRSDLALKYVVLGAAPLRLVPAGTAALQLLTSCLRGALSGSALSSGLLADTVASHVAELIMLSLDPVYAATPPASVCSVRAARLAAVKADIERDLTDGSL